jgi:hypothetical protein
VKIKAGNAKYAKDANGIFRVVRVFRIKFFALKIYGETEVSKRD